MYEPLQVDCVDGKMKPCRWEQAAGVWGMTSRLQEADVGGGTPVLSSSPVCRPGCTRRRQLPRGPGRWTTLSASFGAPPHSVSGVLVSRGRGGEPREAPHHGAGMHPLFANLLPPKYRRGFFLLSREQHRPLEGGTSSPSPILPLRPVLRDVSAFPPRRRAVPPALPHPGFADLASEAAYSPVAFSWDQVGDDL